MKYEMVPISEICVMMMRSSDYYKQSEIVGDHEGAMILQASNIENNKLNFDGVSYYSMDGYNARPRDKVEVGDVLLVKFAAPAAPYKSAVVDFLPEPAITNPSIIMIKNIKCNPHYLQLLISSPVFQQEMKRLQNKGSIPAISAKSLYTVSVPIPSDNDQDTIVEFFIKYRETHFDLIKTLNNEITKRNKQFDYYMNRLLWGED